MLNLFPDLLDRVDGKMCSGITRCKTTSLDRVDGKMCSGITRCKTTSLDRVDGKMCSGNLGILTQTPFHTKF